MFGIKEKLVLFRNRLTEKAGSLYQETEQLKKPDTTINGAPAVSQQNAVKLAQWTIRALVLLDIADIIGTLLND